MARYRGEREGRAEAERPLVAHGLKPRRRLSKLWQRAIVRHGAVSLAENGRRPRRRFGLSALRVRKAHRVYQASIAWLSTVGAWRYGLRRN